MKTIEKAIDSFQIPNLVKGVKREYYKMGAVAMARHIPEQSNSEYDLYDKALSLPSVQSSLKDQTK